MPVCTIGYKPGNGRELAVALIEVLPDMIVEAMNLSVGMELMRKGMTIRLVAFDPADYNVPDLEVAVMTGRGARDRTYNARDRIRDMLMISVVTWLDEHPALRDEAALKEVDVDLRFVDMCGVNFDAVTGKVRSHWGAPRD